MPGSTARPCFDCGEVTYRGRRCNPCQRAYDRQRNPEPSPLTKFGRPRKPGKYFGLTRDVVDLSIDRSRGQLGGRDPEGTA